MKADGSLYDTTSEVLYTLDFASNSLFLERPELIHEEVYIPACIEIFGLEQIKEIVKETWLFIALKSRHKSLTPLDLLLEVSEALKKRKIFRSLSWTLNSILPAEESLKKLIHNFAAEDTNSFSPYFLNPREEDLQIISTWLEACKKRLNLWKPPLKDSHYLNSFEHFIVKDPWFASKVCIRKPKDLSYFLDIKQYVKPSSCQHELSESKKQKKTLNVTLCIGDSPKDFIDKAHTFNYPIIPGKEEICWNRLITEAWPRFLSGTFSEIYQKTLMDEFNAEFPLIFPWEVKEFRKAS